jgi:hypothetical protein
VKPGQQQTREEHCSSSSSSSSSSTYISAECITTAKPDSSSYKAPCSSSTPLHEGQDGRQLQLLHGHACGVELLLLLSLNINMVLVTNGGSKKRPTMVAAAAAAAAVAAAAHLMYPLGFTTSSCSAASPDRWRRLRTCSVACRSNCRD